MTEIEELILAARTVLKQLQSPWVIVRSVFYLYGVDWEYLYRPPGNWWKLLCLQRN